METTIFAGGCFWCIEAVYNRIQGVEQAVSGYINGHTEAPSYAAVCQGDTGHAKAVQIRFDPAVVSYRTLLEILFSIQEAVLQDQYRFIGQGIFIQIMLDACSRHMRQYIQKTSVRQNAVTVFRF